VKCRVCAREATGDLCVSHRSAKESLEAAYPRWVRAYGKMEWKEYLDRVKRNVQTGRWAMEVAELLERTS
jgi:hypothetical protein